MNFFIPTMKSVEAKSEAILETLRELRVVSKFKEVEEYQRRNNLIRADIRLSKYAVARLVVDLRGRIQDNIMIGYVFNGKFKAINHIKYEVATENYRKAAQDLERILFGLYQGYHHRIEAAFKKAKIDV